MSENTPKGLVSLSQCLKPITELRHGRWRFSQFPICSLRFTTSVTPKTRLLGQLQTTLNSVSGALPAMLAWYEMTITCTLSAVENSLSSCLPGPYKWSLSLPLTRLCVRVGGGELSRDVGILSLL